MISQYPSYICGLAVFSAAYIVASLAYLVGVRVIGFGTPFSDSLTPRQRELMRESARKRRTLFYTSFSVAAVVLGLLVARARRA